jgi:hypothetical protein
MARTKPVDLDALLDTSGRTLSKGQVTPALGPSDSSDSGPDLIGVGGLDGASDRNGTGERVSIEEVADSGSGADIAADDVVNAEDAGLGGGLDQAEEAQYGVTDEELERALQDRLGGNDDD